VRAKKRALCPARKERIKFSPVPLAHDPKTKEVMVMLHRRMTMLALAVACLTAAAAVPMAQARPMRDNGNAWVYQHGHSVWSPRLNIIHSERYSRRVATNPAYRHSRMRVECGPISDPVLHQNCLDSFAENVQAWRDGSAEAYYRDALGAPAYGSSMPPQPYISGAGR
jgi:hypothetical protein